MLFEYGFTCQVNDIKIRKTTILWFDKLFDLDLEILLTFVYISIITPVEYAKKIYEYYLS